VVLHAEEKDVQLSQIISQADRLFERNNLQDLYDLLMPYNDIQTAEIQWRCSRVCHELSILPNTDKDQSKQLAYASLAFATKALELDETNYQCHKVSSFLVAVPICIVSVSAIYKKNQPLYSFMTIGRT